MAAGNPNPMVPIEPEVRNDRGFFKDTYCAAPHLMLADAVGEDGIAPDHFVQALQNILGAESIRWSDL
jgi:hypothetical protein